MRLLPQTQQDAVLSRACQFIKNNYDFYLPDCADAVRVISGEEEGLFGWLAVNYLMDGFDRHTDDREESKSSTFAFSIWAEPVPKLLRTQSGRANSSCR